MRPLKLRLSGLHSYREEVTIDFTALGQFGLFGIFGDIGSGKSTILDGITLALYGVIDRVHGRSRRGIVNHHVDRIDVTRSRDRTSAIPKAWPRGSRHASVGSNRAGRCPSSPTKSAR